MTFIRITLQRIKKFLAQTQFAKKKSLTDVLSDYQYRIDSNTYADLMLEDFREKFDNTITSYGKELFNHWSRTIKSNRNISIVQEDIRKIQESGYKIKIAQFLNKIDQQHRGNIISDLWSGFQIESGIISNIGVILSINASMLVFLSVVFTSRIILWVLVFLCINLAVYISTNKQITQVSGSIEYFIRGIRFIEKMDKHHLSVLSIRIPEFRKLKKINWCIYLFKDGFGSGTTQDLISIFIDYFRIFLSLEVIAYRISSAYILKNIQNVQDIIYFTAYYDCILNSAQIMTDNKTSFSHIKETEKISFTEMVHPLLKNPVSQSNRIQRGMIITGLNMAGKSTFMRSIGLNQLLATSFGFTFSSEFITKPRLIVTSLGVNDQLLENKSRYFAEAERLAELIQIIKNNHCLCFIDEILSGTNSEDRILGSIGILKRLNEFNTSIIVSATHDRKIAETLEDIYDPGYFDGQVNGDNISFDYTLKKGIVSDKNGLLILKVLGIEI